MTGDSSYDAALGVGLVLATLTAVASLFVTTPYGRFQQSGMGPSVPIRLGWVLMELPALSFYVFYVGQPEAWQPVPLLFAGVWTLHYANRLVAFPLLMRTRPGSRMSVSVFASGWVVVPLHAWLYANWFGRLGSLDTAWLTDPRFVMGLPLYGLGLVLILHTEAVLRSLRAARSVADEDGYKIPFGGAYRWVSSPHYLGEILAWTGLALASGCPGGLFIWAITLANLVPRASATHRWYRKHFQNYPRDRRALIPYLW
jgi:3-oxo-5-alpha-steroid 4-dehydrogenase 1